MITWNINIGDRSVNGMVGKLDHFLIRNRHVEIVYLKSDDLNIGRGTMQSDLISKENR